MTSISAPTSAPRPRHPKAVERLRLARQLMEQELRRVAVGDRLPSVRDLRQRCGVGLAQLQTVVADMEREGLIQRRLRSGLYKARSPRTAEALTTIDLIACGRLTDIRLQNKGSFTSHLTEALAAEAGERGIGIRLHQVYAYESIARYEAIAEDPAVRACLLLAPHLPELSALFEHRGVQTVSLFPKQPQAQGPVIIVDSQDMVKLQLEHLWELGHRRIAYMEYVVPQLSDMVFLQRREAYYRLMAQRGATVEPHWVFHVPQEAYDDTSEKARMNILAEVFKSSRRPTAIIVGDLFAPTVYRYAQSRQWRIGHDLSVVGTDDVPIAAMLQPALTTVHNDRAAAARMAVDSLFSLIQDRPTPSMREVPLQRVVRQSTGPCPPDGQSDRLRS